MHYQRGQTLFIFSFRWFYNPFHLDYHSILQYVQVKVEFHINHSWAQ